MSNLFNSDMVSPVFSADMKTLAGKAQRDTPESVAKAASQFEALLISQLLQSARESGGDGWMGTDPGDADSSLMDMSEQQLASTIAMNGGIGLATMVKNGLSKSVQEAHSRMVK